MQSAKVLIYLLVCAGLATLACATEETEPPTYSDTADTIRVTVGGRFMLALESNPSTGYQWQFTAPYDSTALKLVEHKYASKPNPDKLVGRGGHDQWLFEALKEGSGSVSLRYLRAWDSTSVAREAEFIFEISE